MRRTKLDDTGKICIYSKAAFTLSCDLFHGRFAFVIIAKEYCIDADIFTECIFQFCC